MSDAPWYKDGLQFQCTQCGDCCTGAPGFVWLNGEEIRNLAALVEMDVDSFEAKYVRKVGIRKSLLELTDGACIFLDPATRKCGVYDARPRQCRTWPFWDSNLASPAAWKHTCEVCPGSGKGRLYQLDEIEGQRKVFKV